MSRKPIIAGNWKLHNNRTQTAELASKLAAAIGNYDAADVVICPTFTSLDAASQAIKQSSISLGAQNVHEAEKGAFTGEITADMLKEAGVQYVIVGHSERRQYFNETDEKINAKVKALYAKDLTPIICVGETLEERESGRMEEVVSSQVKACLAGLPADKVAASVIAYEPVWAIGTGKTASKEQAQEVHALIRGLLTELFGKEVAEAVRIQYGGSVKPDNVKELMAQPDIDGALVGGAALDADSFAAIVKFQ